MKQDTLDAQPLEVFQVEALDLFRLPLTLGQFEDEDLVIGVGKFGPYVRHKSKFFSLAKDDDPFTIKQERAIEIIIEKRAQEENRNIKQFDEEPGLLILNGRYGPYISFNKKNYRIPKSKKPEDLTLEECREIIEKTPTRTKKK